MHASVPYVLTIEIFSSIHTYVIFMLNIVMCSMSFDLENGDHQLMMNDDKPEYGMQMTCDDGFIMIGEKNFTCKKNGNWNTPPSQTKCVGK